MRQKSNGTTPDPDGINDGIILFAICGSILLQVFVKAHNISAKARENDRDKNNVTQGCRTDRSGCL